MSVSQEAFSEALVTIRLTTEQLHDTERERDEERRLKDEAITLLRAIWHSEGPDKWPDPEEFRRRVEALVGEPPSTQWSNRTRRESDDE